MSDKPLAPAIEGWHTMDAEPHLIGTCCRGCGTYFFPKQDQYCRNPACDSTEFDEVGGVVTWEGVLFLEVL